MCGYNSVVIGRLCKSPKIEKLVTKVKLFKEDL